MTYTTADFQTEVAELNIFITHFILLLTLVTEKDVMEITYLRHLETPIFLFHMNTFIIVWFTLTELY